MTDVFQADAQGCPVLRERAIQLPDKYVFAGWWQIERKDEPYSVSLRHELKTNLYTSSFWVWLQGADKIAYPLACRKPHPQEAGPVLIQNSADVIHCYFEPNKPIFARIKDGTAQYDLVNQGWLGVLVRPVGQL